METSKTKRSFKELVVDTFRANGITTEWIPYVLFLTMIALFWIANTYYAEKTVREIHEIKKDVKELRTEYMSTKLDLMNSSKQSQVAQSVKPIGLKESRTAPKKLILKQK